MKDAYQNDENSENENFQRIFSVIMIENREYPKVCVNLQTDVR